MFWRRKKTTPEFKLSNEQMRDIILTVIRTEECRGYLPKPGLMEEALEAVRSANSEEESINILEGVFKRGMYWHWTDGYAGTC